MNSISIQKNTGESNLTEIIDLIRLASNHLEHNALGDHSWLDLTQGGRSSVGGFIAKLDGHSHIVGYCQISKGPTSWGLEYVIHPGHLFNSIQIGTALIKHALNEIIAEGGGHVHMWVPKPDEISDAIASTNNMKKARQVIQMRCDIFDIEELSGLTKDLNIDKSVVTSVKDLDQHLILTYLKTQQDEQDWLKLNNEAFYKHPEQGNWDHQIFNQRKKADWFDPKGLLLCRDTATGELVGSCWIKIHDHHDLKAGEIYVIAVSPNFQGRKIGKFLMKCGLSYMKSIGLKKAMIYVDSNNLTAIKLYEQFGFKQDHIDQAYVIDLVDPTAKPTK